MAETAIDWLRRFSEYLADLADEERRQRSAEYSLSYRQKLHKPTAYIISYDTTMRDFVARAADELGSCFAMLLLPIQPRFC